MINIQGLDKATLLTALYNHANTHDFGVVAITHTAKQPMTLKEAQTLLATSTSFQGVRGRVLNVDFASDTFDPTGYNHANWPKKAEDVIEQVRQSQTWTAQVKKKCSVM